MKMYTVAEISQTTGIPINTVQWHIKQGTLTAINVGGGGQHTGMRLISQDACDRYKVWATENYKSRQK